MKKRIVWILSISALLFLACAPAPPTVILHNSCSGYTTLRNLSFPAPYTSIRLDSLGLPDSLGKKDSTAAYQLDTRIYLHPEDRVWLTPLQSVFPEAGVFDDQTRGQVHVYAGINGLAFDSMPFSRRILVLNGTGKPGLARDAAYRFNIKFGLASLEPQTADADTHTRTALYCSRDDVPLATKLRDYLGAGDVQARTNLVDMIIVLGADALQRTATKPAPRGVSIVVKKSMFELLVFKNGNLIGSYPIAIGRNKGDKKRRGDCRTPEGSFTITSIENSSAWEHDFGDGKGSIQGAYGPWFFRLSTLASETKSGKLWTGIAIHGTHDNASIGTRASEGCVRMHNADVDSLKRMVRVGTQVRIEK
jgi:lipoprotein-anchoring transpeptidase ErfK/SrfK